MAYEAGLITSEEDLQYYDPTNNWDTLDSAYSLLTDPGDIEHVESSLCDGDDGNVRARSRTPKMPDGVWGRAGAEELRRLKRQVNDHDDWGPTYDKEIPPLGINEYTDHNVCTRCNLAKRREYFPTDPRKENGLHSWCKRCQREAAKTRYERKTK